MAKTEQAQVGGDDARQGATDGREERSAEHDFIRSLMRASAGALLFALPTLLTMEMWALGFHIHSLRLGLFMVLVIPLLVALGYYAGFEENFSWVDIVLDAFVAYAVGYLVSMVLLVMMAVMRPGMSLDEIVGKVAIQATPASIGAMLTNVQLWQKRGDEDRRRRGASYAGTLFLSAVGALTLAFSLSSTEEMVLVGYKMTEWHAIAMVLASLLVVGGFVYSVESSRRGRTFGVAPPMLDVQIKYGVVGYAIALLMSAYILWTFGRFDGSSFEECLMATIVLGFPASVGVGAARLTLR
jgi:putative integral membrane protein (TIGR02587 family)